MVINSRNDLRNLYWGLLNRLNKKQQLNYLWETFGDTLTDQVDNWEFETLVESIDELKELVNGGK